jgi:hypothetical protein
MTPALASTVADSHKKLANAKSAMVEARVALGAPHSFNIARRIAVGFCAISFVIFMPQNSG